MNLSKKENFMKYIISFLLLGLLSAPAMAQRPHRGDHKKQDQRVEKHVDEKGCNCAALKKQVEGLRNRLEEATKGREKAGKGHGNAGKHRGHKRCTHRRGSRSEGHRGSCGGKRGRYDPRNEEHR